MFLKKTKGRGPDPDKPPCRKAKDLRRERKLKKLLQKQQQIGMADVSQHQEATCETPKALLLQHRDPQGNQPKSLEELTSESLSPDAVHQLEVPFQHFMPLYMLSLCSINILVLFSEIDSKYIYFDI